MEEIKAAQSAAVPPTTAPSQPSQSILPPLPPKTKKRPLDRNPYIQYSKIRACIRDIRPHFLQVLKTPDFRNGNAANEIRERMKLLQDMYTLMMATTSETLYIEKTSTVFDGLSSSVDNQDRRFHDGKLGDKSSTKSYESNHPSSCAPEKPWANDGQIFGSYIVGGSAFGWNFIAFKGTEPVYYGVSKGEFREKNPIVSSES